MRPRPIGLVSGLLLMIASIHQTSDLVGLFFILLGSTIVYIWARQIIRRLNEISEDREP